MPKRTDISSIPPSPPLGGEGKLRAAKQGEGGVCVGGDGCDCRRSLALCAFPSPPEGGQGGLFPVLANRVQYHSGDTFGVFENVAVGETDDFVAFALHERGSCRVIGFRPGVAVAVEFDDQLVAARSEVSDILGSEHHLADELDCFQSATTQDRPELFFRRRHFGSEIFGVVPSADVAFGQSNPPSPWQRFASPFPLPLKGAREVPEALYA